MACARYLHLFVNGFRVTSPDIPFRVSVAAVDSFTKTSHPRYYLPTFRVQAPKCEHPQNSLTKVAEAAKEEALRLLHVEESQISAEIDRLKRELSVQRRRRKLVQSRIADHQCSIRRLPTEILSQIFIACLDWHTGTEIDTPPIPILDSKACPWVLALVCKRWRDLALGTPILWSTIGIDVDEIETRPKRREARIYMAEEFLRRSMQRPLNVRFVCNQHERHPLLDAVSAHATRWKYA
ncbi:hypothetical protein HGRIS_004438 [Hohenbuehelia grisea]|uniref:F-box domain-containing protein n=1 Tax=Hohenbuehelia grisea TaxID=104357 RepID=A0ABR3JCN7_9AGAR